MNTTHSATAVTSPGFYVLDYYTGKLLSGPFSTVAAARADERQMAIAGDGVIVQKRTGNAGPGFYDVEAQV